MRTAWLIVPLSVLALGCKMRERPVAMDSSVLDKIQLTERVITRAAGDLQPYIAGMGINNLSDKELTSVTVEFQLMDANKRVIFRKDLTWDNFTDATTGYTGTLLPNSSTKVSKSLGQHDLPSYVYYWAVVKSAQGFKKGDDMSDLGHFFAAITRKDNATVRRALEQNRSLATAKDPTTQVSGLDQACISDNVEAFQMFVDRGAKLDYVLLSGNTPLFVALQNYSFQIAKQLIGLGVDVKEVHNGQNALQLAASNAPPEIISMLIQRGAAVNSNDPYWNSPLAIAAQRGDPQIVKLFLDAHADPNKLDRYYGGPLHRAAYGGNKEVVKLLLDAGADPNAILAPKRPYTPLMLAMQYGHPEIAEMMQEAVKNRK